MNNQTQQKVNKVSMFWLIALFAIAGLIYVVENVELNAGSPTEFNVNSTDVKITNPAENLAVEFSDSECRSMRLNPGQPIPHQDDLKNLLKTDSVRIVYDEDKRGGYVLDDSGPCDSVTVYQFVIED